MKKSQYLLLFCVLTAFVGCVEKQDSNLSIIESNIMHGEKLTRTEYSFLVPLYSEDKNLICSGSILEESFVLTAAHCLSNRREVWIKYRGEFIRSDLFHIHPQYIHQAQFDIALIKLASRTNIGQEDSLMMTNLNKDEQLLTRKLNQFESISLLGYGMDENHKRGEKKITKTTLREISEHMLTHRHQKNGSCYSDSGGPSLLINNEGKTIVLGISSTALGSMSDFRLSHFDMMSTDGPCMPENKYSRIDLAIPWIKEVLAHY